MEILVLTNLKSLKLRNNPIAEIPDAISELRSLETLCISFNVLLSLPAGFVARQDNSIHLRAVSLQAL